MWLHAKLIRDVISHCRKVFAEASYYYTTIPTYPSGQIGFIIARRAAEGEESGLGLKSEGEAGKAEGKGKGKSTTGFVAAGGGGSRAILGAPVRLPDEGLASALRYYTPRIHEAAFVLPAFVERALGM